ncbi:ABC transporter permease [Halorussus sp. MSC15.2]|uniref:ABC transporter permease n=1 Tax=Halorussus sp. MSC15.2 TaxID=2283638 RepID=UPI0013D5990A|nr:ABC transporter permease [Halorussus sp. MSC15.2]NEU56668.1 ABC transporter permease [Halorussus sp. MSC15.2]
MRTSRYSEVEERSDVFRKCYHVAKADFLARVRDRRLFAVVVASVYLGHLTTVGDVQLVLGDPRYRGVYNAAWIGTVMALTASAAMAVFGFYLVKDAVARDEGDGPGQLVASSSISDLEYLFGKWASNLAVLASLMVVMAGSVVALLWLRGTGPVVVSDVVVPFVFVAFPVAALVAAVAVLFETTPVLRGSLGNVVYFFGLVVLVVQSPVDPLGGTLVKESMETALVAQHPAYDGSGYVFGQVAGSVGTFRWSGLDVTRELLVHRVAYLTVAVALIAIAAVPFRRFDPAAGPTLPGASRLSALLGRGDATGGDSPADDRSVADPTGDEETATAGSTGDSVANLPEFDGAAQSMRPLRLLGAELRMAVRGRSKLWYLGAAVLVGGGLVAGPQAATGGLLVVAWVWPMFVWSGLGAREHRYRTESLVFSSNYPVAQLAATWLAGVVVAVLFVAPAAAGLALTGEATRLAALAVGVVFVPSLALAAGVVSKSSRLFEIGYLLLWYLGPANRTTAIDYSGVTSAPPHTVASYGVAAVLLLGLALFVRRRRVA